MSLGQDIRNAYDARDREYLEDCIRRVTVLEAIGKAKNQNPVPVLDPRATLVAGVHVGYCAIGPDLCNCGGDLPRIQAACANWKGPAPA